MMTVMLFNLNIGDVFRFKSGSRKWYIAKGYHPGYGMDYEARSGPKKRLTTNTNRLVEKANFK